MRVGECSNAFRSPSTDHRLLSHRQPSTRCQLPKVWRRADIIAVLKWNKPADDAKNYRPIALLCVPLKLPECLLLSILDPQLPPEQAGFRHGRSTTDQVTLLTDDIAAGSSRTKTLALLSCTLLRPTILFGYVVSI